MSDPILRQLDSVNPSPRVLRWHEAITTSSDAREIAAHGLLCVAMIRAGMRLAERQGMRLPDEGAES